MKIKKLLLLGSVFVLSLSSLLNISVPLAHAATVTCTWTDASGQDNNFSTGGNWANCGNGVGQTQGDVYNLIFPASASGFNPIDDMANLTVGTITFSGNFNGQGYDISSSANNNVLTTTGGITDNSSGATNEIDTNLTLSGSQTYSAGSGSQLIIGDASEVLAIGANTLTLANVSVNNPLSGSGSLNITDAVYPTDSDGVDLLAASPNFTGTVAVNQGALFVDTTGALSAAGQITVANGAFLKGNGSLGSATIQSGGTVAPGHSPGCISAGSMTISGNYAAEIGGTTACSGYDQLQISNSVNVSNGTLQLSLVNGFTPSIGQSFKIIDNSGSNPVTGTFNGLAEGATLTVNGIAFRISYAGGDGNDIVLTVIDDSAAASAGSNGANAPGTPNTGLAAIMAHPVVILFVTVLATVTLIGTARRLKPVK